jgi:hypothetical protein
MTIIKKTTLAMIPLESKKLELVVWTSVGLENDSMVLETASVAVDKAVLELFTKLSAGG